MAKKTRTEPVEKKTLAKLSAKFLIENSARFNAPSYPSVEVEITGRGFVILKQDGAKIELTDSQMAALLRICDFFGQGSGLATAWSEAE